MTAKSERIGTNATWLNAVLVLAGVAGVFAQFWSNPAQGADSKSADPQEDVYMIRNPADNSVHSVPQSEFPIAFVCSGGSGGGGSFRIMKGDAIKRSPAYEALIIFPDEPGRRGFMVKQGLWWHFSWGSAKKTGRRYTLIIKPGGSTEYYDSSIKKKNGEIAVSQILTCQ